LISLDNISKRYGSTTVVDSVSLTVSAGETLVLLGTSGSGKTTTLKLINRLLDPNAGTVCIDGRDVVTQPGPELRRSIGYVVQDGGLFPHYTVAQNIGLVPTLLGWEPARIQQRISELLARLRLPDALRDRYPDELSGGQRQRVGLARALAADPPIVLMDEPLGALDPVTRADIRQEFNDLDELRRKTIVLVTHDIQEAIDLGDRIALMDSGQIQQIGPPDELLRQPANAFVESFFAGQLAFARKLMR
jgi:osmoprotectant transport system ATP-binding protein